MNDFARITETILFLGRIESTTMECSHATQLTAYLLDVPSWTQHNQAHPAGCISGYTRIQQSPLNCGKYVSNIKTHLYCLNFNVLLYS